ncbi:vWA domain-containing protein [Luteibacter aegosomatissinici]|uniref:vWA domain-containing protein n=1 Tax=Luteibacter aegosomatissinici TaxID=2911539 RepID=UPI001FF9298A|nr:VWA domain-containing protein [Luteibacter aegosomatissinici]UPG96302.1 VWA domain-containing protein [Luteibacter aegosomatissinici]
MNTLRITLSLLFTGLVVAAGAAGAEPPQARHPTPAPPVPEADTNCATLTDAGYGYGAPMPPRVRPQVRRDARAAGAPAVAQEALGYAGPVALAAPPPPPAPPAPGTPAMNQPTAKVMASAPVMGYMGAVAMQDVDTSRYAHRDTNPVHQAAADPVSTFSIDVDTGSYTNVRHLLNQGQLPPADAVRSEEFINYFNYGYTAPKDRSRPFTVTTEFAPSPWNPNRQLLLVGIQGYTVPASEIPAANLVFLVDVSGSMNEPDKLPLLKASLKQIVPKLRAQDRISLVTYAGSTCVALPATAGDQHAKINAAIDSLGAGGSTNGAAGIDLAYAQAAKGFIKGGVNRVILATDGDFNVGTVGVQQLKDRIADKRRSGVALTTLGFGEGNYNDEMAVTLADVGNGSHHYIDSLEEGRRVLVDEMSATLMTIAKDVKIQVEFNPGVVAEYRLIGYEKRMLAREDFNNDAVDAGEIGAGANVTALYEITLKGAKGASVDPLRYGTEPPAGKGDELGFLRLRYKAPDGGASQLIEQPLGATVGTPSERMRFAAAVAAFADNLRGGKYSAGFGYDKVAELARSAQGKDEGGYRAGMARLADLAGVMQTPVAGTR